MDCPLGGEALAHPHDPCAPSVAGPCEAADVPSLELGDEYWRREVADRVQRYRSRRRPRAPRYPSLCLPFDSPDNRAQVSGTAPSRRSASVTQACVVVDPVYETGPQTEVASCPDSVPRVYEETPPYDNVIEFPRSADVPVHFGDELAEPILDRPRIVEAPEVLPPPPAMGGILIESATEHAHGSVSSPMHLPIAPLGRRLLASVVDGFILMLALVAFGAIFWWVNPQRPPLPLVIAGGMTAAAILWATYEFLFVVYTGSTPGLRLLKLHLTRFGGSAVSRSVCRWRVLGSYLSALSLGLGYLWSILDEDGLCWHDRMTRTHISQ